MHLRLSAKRRIVNDVVNVLVLETRESVHGGATVTEEFAAIRPVFR